MDNMINSAPIGHNLAMHYDRNEINYPAMQICSSCDGWGKIFYSDCCGEKIVDNKCTHCGDASFNVWDQCEQCNGDGEVEI